MKDYVRRVLGKHEGVHEEEKFDCDDDYEKVDVEDMDED